MSESLLEREKKPKSNKVSKQQMPLSGADQLKAKWQRQVGSAKVLWGRLTEVELMDSEGNADNLASLVQQRYALSRIEAEKQVDAFLRRVF